MSLLEERVSRELSNAQSDTKRRLDSHESFIRKELLLIKDDLIKEQEDRSGITDQISNELQAVSKIFEQKITQLNQLISSRVSELRDQLLQESRVLSEEIFKNYRTIYEELEKAFTNLETKKTDRRFIATLLMRMAGSLQAEPLEEPKNILIDLKPKETKKSA